MEQCFKCHKNVTVDEIAITKKLVNRGSRTYYCVSCLAEIFEVEPKFIIEKINFYKEKGCTLFPCNQKD